MSGMPRPGGVAGPPAVGAPRAVRVTLRRSSMAADIDPVSLEAGPVPSDPVLVDRVPLDVRLERRDETHAVLAEGRGETAQRTPVVILPLDPLERGTVAREVLVDGWRIPVEIESEQRAALRERARRGRGGTSGTGRTELRAVIPGRVVAVTIAAGDKVTAGQQVMVVEAMKMQNQLRVPRDGVVANVAVGPGRTVELGDLLLVLE